MSHQLNIFLLLFGALQGGLLSLWFLKNQHKKISNVWFACFLIAVGLQLTLKVIAKSWMMENAFIAYILSYKLPYLVGPLLFLYVRAKKYNSISKTDFLHFVPFVIITLITFLNYFSSSFDYLRWHPYTHAALQFATLIAYSAGALKFNNAQLKNFILFVTAAETVIIFTLAIMVVFYPRFADVRLLFLSLTFLIYWISYKAISQPDLFLDVDLAPIISMGVKKNPKYAHSSLKSEEAVRIENELKNVMGRDKLYLDSSLTIDVLSEKIKTSRHHLSQVLNEKLNRTYVDYLCDLRLEEARKRLSEPSNFRFTIAAIALDSGFNSVSSFNDVFKRRFGITPSRFRDQHLKQMSA
jgi:AraC-like DNA-binding protein